MWILFKKLNKSCCLRNSNWNYNDLDDWESLKRQKAFCWASVWFGLAALGYCRTWRSLWKSSDFLCRDKSHSKVMKTQQALFSGDDTQDVSTSTMTLLLQKRATHPYHRVFFGVVLWDGDVVIGDFGRICCRLLSIPHDVVQVWKVMIEVDSFKAVSSVSPAGQLWALQPGTEISNYNCIKHSFQIRSKLQKRIS